jgi:hypothetical protein
VPDGIPLGSLSLLARTLFRVIEVHDATRRDAESKTGESWRGKMDAHVSDVKN